jgi:hypothetical protein
MEKVRKSWLTQYESVKNLIQKEFGQNEELGVRNLCKILGRLGTYHYKKNGFLLGTEKKLYDLLITNGFNPFTVYRWALLDKIPEDIKFQLRNHYLGQKRASKLMFERNHETETTLQKDIKQLGLKLIEVM